MPLTAGRPGWDDAVRVVRSNLAHTLPTLPVPVVLMTGTARGEGTTTVCAGVAAALARSGRRVVAVDMDLRRPALHVALGGHDLVGTWQVLTGDIDAGEALQVRPDGLRLLAAGPPAGDPAAMLEGPAAGRLLGELAASADVVLVDTAPVPGFADVLSLAGPAGGAVLTVLAGRTSLTAAERAKMTLERAGIPVIGAVLVQGPAGRAAGLRAVLSRR